MFNLEISKQCNHDQLHFIQTSFKRETVLAYALVNAFTEMEGNVQFFSMETKGTSITHKKVLKGVFKLTVSLNIKF